MYKILIFESRASTSSATGALYPCRYLVNGGDHTKSFRWVNHLGLIRAFFLFSF